MTAPRYDVVGIGNAIVDIIGRCDEALLTELGKTKGAMALVDRDEIARIYQRMGPAVEMSGGSAANTIAGIASFGGSAGFIGKVADDEFGRIFSHDIRSLGVAFNSKPIANGNATSRSLILVTPDGERTMNTYLGISTEFERGHIDADLIRDGAILYLEGYLFDGDDAKDGFRNAIEIARRNGRLVSLTLSDGFCVDRHRDSFLELIRSGVDILFANESEIKSLYQTSDFETAAAAVRQDAKLSVLTRSEKGSVIVAGEKTVTSPAEPVEAVIDTTGAGDLYASGFLFGYSRGMDLAQCGRLAGIAAAQIISQIGPRSAIPLRDVARQKGIAI